jgi:hypothetical protein
LIDRAHAGAIAEMGDDDFLVHAIGHHLGQGRHVMRMAKLAELLMTDGGVLVTMSHYGADKVIEN